MKKPEEIKKGLEICLAFPMPKDGCNRCPYIRERMPTGTCRTSLKNDALALIQQLETDRMAWEDVASSPGAVEDMAIEINRLQAELQTVKRERDAALSDFKAFAQCKNNICHYCATTEAVCGDCGWIYPDLFVWRGVCKENTEDEK